MPLLEDLTDGTAWPPAEHVDRLERQEDHQRLYRNDRAELLQRFSAELDRWARQEDLVPYPAAKIAARTLAAFLFGEDPTITHRADEITARLEALARSNNLPATLLEGAITQGVEGEVYLRAGWDRTVDPRHAIITPIPGRHAIPEFRFGRLLEVAFVRTAVESRGRGITGPGATYWRHLEIHTRGQIDNVLYRGRSDTLGAREALTDHRLTVDLPETQPTGVNDLLAVHVPLGRDADTPHGVSLFDGVEGLILALHRLYSQEQHDAELARRRLAVPETYLHRDQRGNPHFDRRTDLLVLSEDAAGPVGGERAGIVPVEFRDDTVMRDRIGGRLRDLLIAVGISPYTVEATEAGGATSGTARKLAQALTLQTVSMIGRYWQHELGRLLMRALMLEAEQLGRQLPELTDNPETAEGLEADESANVQLADGVIDDPAELAVILRDLDTAEALSTEEKVRRLNPAWDAVKIAEEVERIQGEYGTAPGGPSVSFERVNGDAPAPTP